MNLQELKKLVQKGEGWQLEFKRKIHEPLKIVREMVAFANKNGGILLLGVSDNGEIPGLKYPDEEAFEMKKAIAEHCSPPIQYVLYRIGVTSKTQVLLFNIHESNEKPVFLIYNLKKKSGRAYIRVNDKSVHASREVRKILQGQTKAQSGGFQYGEKEHQLMQLFSERKTIDLNYFCAHTGISVPEASDTLVKLTIANVLEIHPGDKGDLFTFKETYDPAV